MAALIKRQQQQQHLAVQQKAGGTQVAQVQVPTQTGLTPAQILAQAGLQVTRNNSNVYTETIRMSVVTLLTSKFLRWNCTGGLMIEVKLLFNILSEGFAVLRPTHFLFHNPET